MAVALEKSRDDQRAACLRELETACAGAFFETRFDARSAPARCSRTVPSMRNGMGLRQFVVTAPEHGHFYALS